MELSPIRKLTMRFCFVVLILGLALFPFKSHDMNDASALSFNHLQSSSLLFKAIQAGPEGLPQLTWTSRDNATPTTIGSGDTATGDHVVLNASFPQIDGTPPSNCSMALMHGLNIVNRTSPGSFILFDTYLLCENTTVDIEYVGHYDSGQDELLLVESLTVNNFFAPEVELITPNGGENWSLGIFNITFASYDLNKDDLLFQIKISKDSGAFWQILAIGPMNYDSKGGYFYYEWETTAILKSDEALVEITVFDNDTSLAGRPHPLYPNSTLPTIWPGYSSNDTSDYRFFLGSSTLGPPPPPSITISSPEDITCYRDEVDIYLNWTVVAGEYKEYWVYRNESQILSGTIKEGTISVPLDHLRVGTHLFKIRVASVPGRVSFVYDRVVVRVLKRTSPVTSLPSQANLVDIAVFGALVIIPVLAFSVCVRSWRRKEGVWATG